MWSRKPTPVSRVPAPVPSSASVSRTSVSPVLRSIVAVRLIARGFSRTRASIDSACTSNPSARAIGRRRGRQLAAAPSDVHLGHAPAEVARGERRGEARRAARRQHVVGAGDVVAERGRAGRADEQAAGAERDHRGERLDLCADELQVLGCECVRERHAPACVVDLHERERRVADGRALATSCLEHRGERIAERARAAHDRHHEAALAVLGLGEHVERRQFDLVLARLCAEQHEQVARTGEAVDPHRSRRASAWPPARTGCPARRPRRRDRRSRCRTRARRSPARRPCGRRARRRTAGRPPRIAGRSRRRPPAASTPRRRTRRPRARSRRPSRRCSGTARGRRARTRRPSRPAPRAGDPLALGQLDRDVLARRPPGRPARRSRSRPAAPPRARAGAA